VAAAFGAVLFAACGRVDAPTAPLVPAAALGAGVDVTPTVITMIGDTTVTEFTVDPAVKATYGIAGEHRITFPSGSICDPATSTYGPTEWDQPCELLQTPITITARSYHDAAGNPRVDFLPALRFAKTQRGPVKLYLLDKRVSASALSILYCPDVGPCVDEALTDPDLVTQYDAKGQFLFRQIKHFSGYTVSVGFADAL